MSVKFRIDFKRLRNPRADTIPSNEDKFFLKGSNGSTVILVHGVTGTPNEMKVLASQLNKDGYSVICPTLANHGQPLEVLKHTGWQEFYQSVRKAFLEIKDENNLIFASGLSIGALLALLLAEEFQDKVAGVSCLSPTLFYDGWNMPWYRCFLPLVYATSLRDAFYFKEEPPYGIKNEDMRQRVHKYYSSANLDDIEGMAQYGYPYFPVTLLYQLHLLVKYARSRLKNISAPLQLIQAKEDDMTSIKNSQFIYDRVSSKVKEMVLLDNSYHVITVDYERDKVVQKMLEFFGGIRRGLK